MDTIICKQCGKEFIPKNGNQKFCNDKECIKSRRHKPKHKCICNFCGKEFETAKDNQICCGSEECLRQKHNRISRDYTSRNQNFYNVICSVCGNSFQTNTVRKKYCSKECYNYAHNRLRTNNKVNKCIDCGCLISMYRTRCKSCNFKHLWNTQYDIQYQATCRNSTLCRTRITKPNKYWGEFFTSLGLEIEYEFPLGGYSYDIKIGKYLIEIDPTRSHNSSFFDLGEPKKTTYHQKKSLEAEKNGYHCIHLFDRDDNDKVKNWLKGLLLGNKRLYHGEIREVDQSEAYNFYEENHLQGGAHATVHYGLYVKGSLINCMSFIYRDKERYLERFASKQGFYIAHGAEKLFKHFIKVYNPSYVISYSDITKHSGGLYNALGFKLEGITSPSYWWVNIKTGDRYWRRDCQKKNMHNLMGFDNTYKYDQHKEDSFWQQSEAELMESHGYVKLCDSGNRRHVRYVNK